MLYNDTEIMSTIDIESSPILGTRCSILNILSSKLNI